MSEQTPAQPSARDEILARIRTALGAGLPAELTSQKPTPEAAYRRTGQLNRVAVLDLFVDRLKDYDAEVLQVGDERGLAGALGDALNGARELCAVVAEGFPEAWLPMGFEFLRDGGLSGLLSIAALDSAQAVVTTCAVAIASTGTIVLVHGGTQGRRAATLLPDHHICLVRRGQVLELVPEALERLKADDPAPITTISGPSATSDIEMTRIRGVHGPRRLTVVLYGPAELEPVS